MEVLQIDDGMQSTLNRAVSILRGFDEVAAIGLSGSLAKGTGDGLSDLDICVFASEGVPDAQDRRTAYAAAGIEEIAYLDVDFEVSRGDGVSINGRDCCLIWMYSPNVEGFLKSLLIDFDCDEFLPGGVLSTRPVYDLHNLIERLKGMVPEYPTERSRYRIRESLRRAHFSLYVLCWLEKAVVRNDYFLFFKHQYDLLDNFFTAVFALNRQWFCEEKRLIEIVGSFELAPTDVRERLRTTMLHTGRCSSLRGCMVEIKGLFGDVVSLAKKQHPDFELPVEWQ